MNIRLGLLVALFGIAVNSNVSSAQEICGRVTAQWVATANGKMSGQYPILYMGLNFPQGSEGARQQAASCAGVNANQLSVNHSDNATLWGLHCGQIFTKCD
jgi:hypothetical protein